MNNTYYLKNDSNIVMKEEYYIGCSKLMCIIPMCFSAVV